MATLTRNGINHIWPADMIEMAEKRPEASITVLRRTKTFLYVSITVPGVARDFITNIRRDGKWDVRALAVAAR